jgi:nicotinate-nucleotide adenylyltransferase
MSAASFRNRAGWSTPALVLLRFDPDPRSATALRKANPQWFASPPSHSIRDAVTHRSIPAGAR